MSAAMNRQALFALLLLVLNTVYLVDALTLPLPFALGEPGPAFMPLILCGTLYLACTCILVAELRGRGEPADESDSASTARLTWRTGALILSTAGFVLLFEPLGYWLATLLYTFVVAAIFEHESGGRLARALPLAAVIALGITTAGWLFFVWLFELFLPTGDW